MDRVRVFATAAVLSCRSTADSDTTPSADTTAAATTDGTGAATTEPTGDPTSVTTSQGSIDTTAGDGTSSDATDDVTGDPPLPRDAVAVAVGYGTRRVRSEDGLTWTDFVEVDPNGGDDDNLLRGVGYGDGVFVAVGGSGAALILRSPDGIAWEPVANELGGFVSDVAWQDGVFAGAGGNGLRARSVDGGASWQDPTPYYAGHFRAIAAGNGVFVAVGHTYGESNVGLSSTSADGATWTPEQTAGAPMGDGALAFGSGVFVARDGAGVVRTTDDGITWSEPVAELDGPGRVIHADGMFLTSGDDGCWQSSDGQRWTPTGGAGRRVDGWIDGSYLSLGWPAAIDASADLERWQNVFAVDGPGLTDIAVGSPGR